MFKLDLEKAEESEIKLPTSIGIVKARDLQKSINRESKRIPEKNIYFCFMSMLKPLTVWITINCGKS